MKEFDTTDGQQPPDDQGQMQIEQPDDALRTTPADETPTDEEVQEAAAVLSADRVAPIDDQPEVRLFERCQIRTTRDIDQFAGALAQAQGVIGDPTKNAKNPFFSKNYADLSQVLSVVRPALSQFGLSVIQFPTTSEDGTVTVTTRLMHQSGQWRECAISCPLQVKAPEEVEEERPPAGGRGGATIKKKTQGGNRVQAMGTLITYLRRYSLAAVAGVAQMDADGNGLEGQTDSPRKGGEFL